MQFLKNDFIRLAKRENNLKRNYLIINLLQGKNFPISPTLSIELFDKLADSIQEEYKDEKVLIVGFAETATAIGTEIAIKLSAKYIQTTREQLTNVEYLHFEEEHSHATEQKLVKDDIDSIIGQVNRIIFVDDEISTGKTVLNIISILEKKYENQFNFSVATILNGLSKENIEIFKNKNIKVHFLEKTNHNLFQNISKNINLITNENSYIKCESSNKNFDINEIKINGKKNPRRLIDIFAYKKFCENLWQEIKNQFSQTKKNILVIGTEECMFPAIFVGKKFEEMGNFVKTHSTTRSPICTSSEENYPLHTRYELKSLYDKNRKTFIYDIGVYDLIFILTDSPSNENEGKISLINAILLAKNKIENIRFIRW